MLGIDIILSDIGTSSWVTLTRSDTAGHYADVVVRGVYLIPETGSDMVFVDYEAPLNTTVTYTIRGYFDSAGTSLAYTVTSSNFVTSSVSVGFTIFTDPLTPAYRASGVVTDLTQWSRSGRNLSESQVMGRSNPVIAKDVLSGRKGTITAIDLQYYTTDYDGYGPYTQYTAHPGGWKEMFDTGSILLFRNIWSASAFDDLYFSVDNVSVSRISGIPGAASTPITQYAIDFTEVDRPALTAGSTSNNHLFTYQDLTDNYATYADLSVKATYQALMNNPIP